ncbi:DUF1559 domain-containing protein [Opitutaceae bacterium TAV4]|nr:DUF1559 domain-containing protein [Opitutaceae bacterium TAV4]RRK02807.1 DUF1559 domain-containing protein [Opitutaceae bacterium TAV3]
MKTPVRTHLSPSAFTLIELLTVIAIIGILAGIMIPVVSSVRKTARNATCLSNLRQIGIALAMFASDNKDDLPVANSGTTNWMYEITGYNGRGPNYLGVPNKDLKAIRYGQQTPLFCEESKRYCVTPSASLSATTYAYNFNGLMINPAWTKPQKFNGSDHPAQLCVIGENRYRPATDDWGFILGAFDGTLAMSADMHGNHSNVLYLDGHVGGIKTIPPHPAAPFPSTTDPFWRY